MATKPVTDLVPGDALAGQPRVVEKVERTATAVVATFTDGGTETWALDGSPSVELADG
jgi:hypothetical protein